MLSWRCLGMLTAGAALAAGPARMMVLLAAVALMLRHHGQGCARLCATAALRADWLPCASACGSARAAALHLAARRTSGGMQAMLAADVAAAGEAGVRPRSCIANCELLLHQLWAPGGKIAATGVAKGRLQPSVCNALCNQMLESQPQGTLERIKQIIQLSSSVLAPQHGPWQWRPGRPGRSPARVNTCTGHTAC